MPEKVILYASRSAEEAPRVPSALIQLERLREHARLKGQEIVGEYHEDSHAGDILNGPTLATIFSRLAAGEASVLKAVHMSRFGESFEHFAPLMERLEKWGVQIELLEGHFDAPSARSRLLAETNQQLKMQPGVLAEDEEAAGAHVEHSDFVFLLAGRLWFAQHSPDGPRFERYHPYISEPDAEGKRRYFYTRESSLQVSTAESVVLARLPAQAVEQTMMDQIDAFLQDEYGPDTHSRLSENAREASHRIAQRMQEIELYFAGKGASLEPASNGSPAAHNGNGYHGSQSDEARKDRDYLMEALLLDLHYLDEWFRRMPVELELAESKLKLLVSSYERGSLRTARAMLRDLLCEPFGVVIWPGHMEVSFRSGAVAGEISQRCVDIDPDWH